MKSHIFENILNHQKPINTIIYGWVCCGLMIEYMQAGLPWEKEENRDEAACKLQVNLLI